MALMLNNGKAGLEELAGVLTDAGWRVLAPLPRQDKVFLDPWQPGLRIAAGALPANSIKDALLPRCEVIARFRLEGDGFRALEHTGGMPPTVVLGVRPCDAAALATLDAVYNWDFADQPYNDRRAATTVVVLACSEADAQCFCTSVGGHPRNTTGADVLLVPAGGGTGLLFEALTDKGRDLARRVAALLVESEALPDPAPEVPVRFELEAVQEWCSTHFESELWAELGLPCLGCGACAWACPTCHCCDIQDECAGADCVRLRNWDSCGFGLFTKHAGGHNPRADQSARWRQRVLHKFRYIPERFGLVGCTGCGRCARLCPAGLAISDVCATIGEAHKATQP